LVIPPFSKPKNLLKISVGEGLTKPSLETSLCTPLYFLEIIPFARCADLLLAKNIFSGYSEFKISFFFIRSRHLRKISNYFEIKNILNYFYLSKVSVLSF